MHALYLFCVGLHFEYCMVPPHVLPMFGPLWGHLSCTFSVPTCHAGHVFAVALVVWTPGAHIVCSERVCSPTSHDFKPPLSPWKESLLPFHTDHL